MRLDGDAAALQARPLRGCHTVMFGKRRCEVAAAEFFDLRLLQSRHQTFAAFDGGDACPLWTLGPNRAKIPVPRKRTVKHHSHTGRNQAHTHHTPIFPPGKNRGCTHKVVAPGIGPEISMSDFCHSLLICFFPVLSPFFFAVLVFIIVVFAFLFLHWCLACFCFLQFVFALVFVGMCCWACFVFRICVVAIYFCNLVFWIKAICFSPSSAHLRRAGSVWKLCICAEK